MRFSLSSSSKLNLYRNFAINPNSSKSKLQFRSNRNHDSSKGVGTAPSRTTFRLLIIIEITNLISCLCTEMSWPKCPQTETARPKCPVTETAQTETAQTETARPNRPDWKVLFRVKRLTNQCVCLSHPNSCRMYKFKNSLQGHFWKVVFKFYVANDQIHSTFWT